MGIPKNDVVAIQIGDDLYHPERLPSDFRNDLTEENCLTEDELEDYEFCRSCGKILNL